MIEDFNVYTIFSILNYPNKQPSALYYQLGL